MTPSPEHTALLRRALELAESAREGGNPPFASLLCDNSGVVIAEAINTTLTDDDITAHPELKLARWAAQQLSVDERATVTMFTSCEPCPMCSDAIGRAGIPLVIFALSNAQLKALKPADAPPISGPFTASGPHLTSESVRPVAGYYG